MFTHTFSQTTFHSRSGRESLFKEAIDHMGASRHGADWFEKGVQSPPSILPSSQYQASPDQIALALTLLKRHDPAFEIRFHEQDWNDSIPDHLIRTNSDPDISVEQWMIARTLSESRYNHMITAYQQFLDVLNDFAVAAVKGKFKTYARRLDTCADEAIEPRSWQVGDDVLRYRYETSMMEVLGSRAHAVDLQLIDDGLLRTQHSCLFEVRKLRLLEVRRMILVNEELWHVSSHSDPTSSEDRRKHVEMKLREAVIISDTIVPHGSMRQLTRDVANYLECSVKEARGIVAGTPGHNWSKRGPRDRELKFKVEKIRITRI